RNQVPCRSIYADDRYDTPLLNTVDCPLKRSGRACLQQEISSGQRLHRTSRCLASDCIYTDIGTEIVSRFLDKFDRVIHIAEVVGLALRILSCKLETILELIDDDHPRCAEEPRTFRRHYADRTGSENDNGIAAFNSAHFG